MPASGIFVRELPGEGVPVVLVHGNPNHSGFWMPFLERLAGPAIAFDLPGFGRSQRPGRAHFDHTLAAYANVIERLLDELAPNGYRLVVHDWGAVALVAAQRHPDRVERLVIVDAVPLSSDYRWHWVARIWRLRGLGEALNALSTKAATNQLLRLARPGLRPMPPEFVEMIWDAELVELDDAGHWPWIDRPELIGRVVEFLEAGTTGRAGPLDAERS